MTPKPRLTGEPIMRILCKKTDTLVGYPLPMEQRRSCSLPG